MTLTLQIENFSVLDDGGPVSIAVPEGGVQVGRSAGMGWVLPDASRHISGHHFDVVRQGDGWFLHDRSTNGTFLQGHRHRLDGPHRLNHGDRFQVGQYIIVALINAPAVQPGMSPGSLPAYDVGSPSPEMPVGDDPWAMPGSMSPIDPMPVRKQTVASDFSSDFVAFPEEPHVHYQDEKPPAIVPQTPVAELSSSSIAMAASPFPAAPQAPPASGPAAAREDMSLPPAPQVVPPSSVVTAPEPAAFVRAFCKGAGLPADLAEGIEAEALAERLGQAMSATTSRLMAALRDRSAARHFTRGGERTMRGASDNNPLKFLPSPEQAIEASFLRPRAGFMVGAGGYDDALGDLTRHQAALFAALQPALAELLQDLDPGRIEAEMKGRSGLAGQRKARAWDSYVERWDAKAAHENGILDEFIRLFADAYRAADNHGDEPG
ncbi:MAG: type VI secretion system-associated FHA domain protein TagH [Paracoccus sp. (in: a-proteobacteria)]